MSEDILNFSVCFHGVGRLYSNGRGSGCPTDKTFWIRWGFKWTLKGKFCVKNKFWDTWLQGCTNPWCQVTTMTKFCKAMPNLFVGPQCVTCFMPPLLIPTSFRQFSNYSKICATLWNCKWASTLHAMITVVTLLLQMTKQKWQKPAMDLCQSIAMKHFPCRNVLTANHERKV